MLMVFYLNAFCPPCLKSLVIRTAELAKCCSAQMVCYHAYVSLLLRLSNDVEENSGPRNINEIFYYTYTVHADFQSRSFINICRSKCLFCIIKSFSDNEVSPTTS
jgi:tRNA A37 methylthiotransferase MiaB